MLRSSIDLGTNTCLLLIAEVGEVGSETVVTRIAGDWSTVVRLGQGVDQDRRLHPDAMDRTLRCLKGYAGIVREAGLDPVETVCVATSQARDARNGAEFFARVEAETGFRFRVISGDEEARASFRGGLLPGMDPARSAVIDIGGGSTEFMALHQGRPHGVSIDLGSVRFTERFLRSDPVTDAEFWSCEKAIDDAIGVLQAWRAGLPPELALVAVAGTATTVASMVLGLQEFDRDAIDRSELHRGDVHRVVEELKWRTVAERRQMTGIEEGRADVLLAGALILWRAMELLRFETCRVSTRGLRFGVLSGPS